MNVTKVAASEVAPEQVPHRLADQLRAILEYRNRPDHRPEAVMSNWRTAPELKAAANEDRVEGTEDLRWHQERGLKISPSENEIERELGVPTRVYVTSARRGGAFTTVVCRKEWVLPRGPVRQIGKLRFSDGSHYERDARIGQAGKVEWYWRRMPKGAMLRTSEGFGDTLGPSQRTELGNRSVAALLGVPHRSYSTGKRSRRRGRSYTTSESRQILAAAIANTAVMPAVTRCPPGLAIGSPNASDLFLGLRVGSTGKGGAIPWEDLYQAQRDFEAWKAEVAALDAATRKVLAAIPTARTFTDVGKAAGQATEYARRRGGKRALIAANDNLKAVQQKIAG